MHEPFDQLDDLTLPPIETIQPHNASYYYGAADIAANYCGLQAAPNHIRGQWQHGWLPRHQRVDPNSLFGDSDGLTKENVYWVARKDDEQHLRDRGYQGARAIGLPIVYLQNVEVERRANTLLVMPIHSLEFIKHEINEERYAEKISAIREEFEQVVICVHPSCIEKGYWVNKFLDRGFEVVTGASATDRNALLRMANLMNGFEFVTTNGTGSHLAYAAYFGAKVSIFGGFIERSEADYSNTPYYRSFPNLIKPTIESVSEATWREYVPELFVEHPRDAEQRIDWAEFEVGCDNRLAPSELRREMGWSLSKNSFRWLSQQAIERAADHLPASAKRLIKRTISSKFRDQEEFDRECSRLEQMPPSVESTTNLLGPSLTFADGPECVRQVEQIFTEELFRFETTNSAPLIIDGGANIGLFTIYSKHSHPNSRILAFEPSPTLFGCLESNCASFQLAGVELFQQALWNSTTTLRRDEIRLNAKGVLKQTDSSATSEVEAVRLRDLLDQSVQLLKLDVAGAELDLLRDCGKMLTNVEFILVRYHSPFSERQSLGELFGILENAGFRVHIRSENSAKYPFVYRPIQNNSDLRLLVFGFRE